MFLDAAQVSFARGTFVDRIDIAASAGQDLEALRTKIQERVGKTYTVQRPERLGTRLRMLTEPLHAALFVSGLLALVVGAFLVYNAVGVAVAQRRREIGTLRAMGTLPGQLLRTLALEGMVLGGAGAVVGAAIALSVSVMLYIVPVQMPPPPGRSTGYPLNIAIDPTLYFVTLVVMVGLAMLASAWVARKTVHQPVVTALAHT
jgi:putative ABC transport system permease protein